MILAYKGVELTPKRVKRVVNWLKTNRNRQKVDYRTARTITYHILAKEYGWTPEQIDALKPSEIVALMRLIEEDKHVQNRNQT